MLRAVLDSSALISAFLTNRGTCAELLRAGGRGAFVLCLSPELLADMVPPLLRERKLQARYGYDQARVTAFCRQLVALAQPVIDLPELSGTVPLDPKDDVVVATALKARADYLVTGDRRHLRCSRSTRASASSRRGSSSISSAELRNRRRPSLANP